VPEETGPLYTMLSLQKSSSPKNTPDELAMSLSVAPANHTFKSLSGIAIAKVNSKLHKVMIRVKSLTDIELNDFDANKSEISLSSVFLPPGTTVVTKNTQSFNISASSEGIEWKALSIEGDSLKAREMLFIYTIVFPLDKANQVTKDALVNDDAFSPPFISWVEINGKMVASSAAKAGSDTHVSIQIMFPHLEKASEDKLSVKFKYKSKFAQVFAPFKGDVMMSCSYVILPSDEKEMAK